MKIFKELPPAIFHSIRLSAIPLSRLLPAEGHRIPVIVSLTSIPERLSTLHLVIRSLMTQTYCPRKIVLWLHWDLKDIIPKKLAKLQSEWFEICYTDLKGPHRKLIHSLKKYPEEIIVTCDDDMIYRKNWLELLYKEHQKTPDYIIGNRTKCIRYKNGTIKHYRKWTYPKSGKINYLAVVAVGAWGILYPPHSLDERVHNVDLFNKLSPHSDDLWFKALGLLHGTKTRQAEEIPAEPIPLPGSQKSALKKINIKKDQNIRQWMALARHFSLDDILLNKKSV